MIGEARYIVEGSDPETCEFAVAVTHAWRGAPLERTLLERLAAYAGAAGLRHIVAAANVAMVSWQRAGFSVRRKREDGRLLRSRRFWPPPAERRPPTARHSAHRSAA